MPALPPMIGGREQRRAAAEGVGLFGDGNKTS